jgi:hypothetical protein
MRIARAWLAIAVLVTVVTAAGSGCIGSEVVRRSIDLQDFRSWAGQPAEVVPDSLAPAFVAIGTNVPEVSAGSFQGVDEVSLFVQLQNQGFTPDELTVYATDRIYPSANQVRENGVRLMRPVLVQAQAAVQIDARNYPNFAEGLDGVDELVRNGDFYLYVVGTGSEFRVGANVPTLSLLVVVD